MWNVFYPWSWLSDDLIVLSEPWGRDLVVVECQMGDAYNYSENALN